VPQVIGKHLRGIWQPERGIVVVGIGAANVVIVPRGPYARIHTVPTRPPNPPRPFSFQGAARAHLGGRLLALEFGGTDRVATLRFVHGALHVRLTGRGGGLWVLGDDDAVIAAYDGPHAERLSALPFTSAPAKAPRFAPGELEGWNGAAREYFEEEERCQREGAQRQRQSRVLRRQRAQSVRLLEALRGDLRRAGDADLGRRRANAFAAVLHTVQPGQAHVTATDLVDESEVFRIARTRRATPGQQLSAMYDRVRRAERRAPEIRARLAEAENAITRIDAALANAAVGPLRAAGPSSGSREKRVAEGEGRRGKTKLVRTHDVWTGPGGQEVWVGRTAMDNHTLTFRTARGRDWWMHVRGQPGPHLILPADDGNPPPLARLLAAAQLAIAKAGVAVGGHADVQYARIKDVRAVRGDRLGRVTVSREKVLHVTRQSDTPAGWTRLQR